MSRTAFIRAMDSMPSFRSLMFNYVHAFLEQVLVSGACNGAHSLKERLARWLLMMRDRSDDDALLITHGLLAEMLAFAQPVALQPQSVPLAAYVSERIEALRERAEVAGVSLQGHADGTSCTFDPEQMSRAIDNLLINALQHTLAGGCVELKAAVADRTITFTVADTGPGIAPEMAARLFEPFATSRADGVGLGLSIVREIAAAHGGTVELAKGDTGATFVITLPCRPS